VGAQQPRMMPQQQALPMSMNSPFAINLYQFPENFRAFLGPDAEIFGGAVPPEP